MRRRVRFGVGPLSKVRWKSTDYSLDVPLNGDVVTVGDDLSFYCAPSPEGWILQGKVAGVACLYGEIRRDALDKGFSFTMLSVSDREVRGRAAMAEATGAPRESGALSTENPDPGFQEAFAKPRSRPARQS